MPTAPCGKMLIDISCGAMLNFVFTVTL
jgi:hypothetical protein